MDIQSIIRAWKNPLFRAQLSPAQLALMPAHPAGPHFFAFAAPASGEDHPEKGDELSEDDLEGVAGGLGDQLQEDIICGPTNSGGMVCTLTVECGCSPTWHGFC